MIPADTLAERFDIALSAAQSALDDLIQEAVGAGDYKVEDYAERAYSAIDDVRILFRSRQP